jgi:lipopolysaccharide export LptBFGC system permease protein LptF
MTIWLYNGSIHEGSLKQHSITTFDVNSISVPYGLLLDDERSTRGPKPAEMSTAQLLARVQDLRARSEPLSEEERKHYYRALVELHRRISLPFAALCVPLLALALGIQPSRSESRWGVTINVSVGLAAVLVYYFVVALATALAETGAIPAFIGMWTPNVLFLTVAFLVFRQIETERWLAVSEAIGHSLASLGQKFFDRVSSLRGEAS